MECLFKRVLSGSAQAVMAMSSDVLDSDAPLENNDRAELRAGTPRTTWEKFADELYRWRRYIGGLTIILIIAGLFGWIPIPQVEFKHWFLVSCFVSGVFLATPLVLGQLKPYLSDKRVRVGVAPANGDMYDIINFPQNTFNEFSVVGSRLPQRRTASGETVYTVRAIDFSRGIFVPAVEFEDGKYPDDIELISENASPSKIEQYRKALLDDAREYQNVTTDREVIRESAMGDTVQVFASAMRDVRDADINLSQMDDEQVMVQAEQLAKDAQGQLNEGEADE